MTLVGVGIVSIMVIWKVYTNMDDCQSDVYEIIGKSAEHRQVQLVNVTGIGLVLYKCVLALEIV
jgi:hypothetical protein